MKFTLILVLAIGLNFSAKAQQEKARPPVIVQKLPVGKSIIIHNNYSIDFLEVTEDSRCPKGVECVWAGQAKVLLMICKDGKEIEKKEVLLKNLSAENPMELTLEASVKALIYQLKPYPTEENRRNLDYYLQITEAKK